jgi:cell division protein FtsB
MANRRRRRDHRRGRRRGCHARSARRKPKVNRHHEKGRNQMKYANGVIAAFVATFVLSAIMLMKSATGLMPQLNVIQMLTGMGANYAGLPASPVIG